MVDAEYHIWYQDNSKGLPAPSDYRITVALRVESDSIGSWIEESLEKSEKMLTKDYWADLKLNGNEWKLNSKSEFYHSKSNREIKLVFWKENVILGVYSTFPSADF